MSASPLCLAAENREDIRLISDWGNESAVISWKNPTSDKITAIDVVDENGVSIVPEGTEIKRDASAVNGFKIQGLGNDTLYNYTVKITEDNNEYAYTTSVIPRNLDRTFTTDGYDISPWKINKEKGYALYIDNEEKYQGSSSLKIKGSDIADYFTMLQDKWYGTDSYEISFMAKAENVDAAAQLLNRWRDPRVTISGNKWKQYTIYSTPGENPNPRIIVDGGCDGVWIDDIVVKKIVDGKGEIVFKDGFELGVINPMAGAMTSGKLVLSWTNPKNDYISDIDVLDSDGKSIKGDATLSLENRAVNRFEIDGLTDGVEYSYTLLFTINGVKTPVSVKGVPVNNDMQWKTQEGYDAGKWKFLGGNNMINRYIDTSEAHSGNSSVKIVSNFTPVHKYGRLETEVGGLDVSKTYIIKFYAKLENNQTAGSGFQSGTKSMSYYNDWTRKAAFVSNNGEWKEYSYTFTGQTKLVFRLGIETQGVLWLDDVSLYELQDGVTVGENLISGGDFEINPQIQSVLAVSKGNDVAISWKNPAEGVIASIDILDGSGNKVIPAESPNTASGAYSRAVISVGEQGKTYNYTISLNVRNGNKVQEAVTFTPNSDFNYTTQNGVKMTDLSKIKIEGSTLRDICLDIDENSKYSGNYGLSLKSNSKTLTSLTFDPINIDSGKKYRASVWLKVGDKNGEVWMANDWGSRTKAVNGDWTKYTFDVSDSSRFIFRLASEAIYSSMYADDFALYELDADGNEIGENLITNGGFENVYGIGKIEFEETESGVKAEIPAYNFIRNKKLAPTLIVASYDESGALKDVCLEAVDVAVSTSKITQMTVKYESGYSVKAFVWSGSDMKPLQSAEIY